MSILSELTVKEYDLKGESDDFLNELFDLWDLLFREAEVDDPLPPRKVRFQQVRNPHPHGTNFNWVVTNSENKIVGSAGAGFSNEKSPQYEDNKNNIWGGVSVHPDYRRKGLGKHLLSLILEKAKKEGKSTLQTGTDSDTGIAFAESFGAEPSQVGGENRLKFNEIDWRMLSEWAKEGPKRASGVEVIEFIDAPDDLISDYMEIYTETMNQQPMGDMEWTYKGTPESRRLDEERTKERDTIWYSLITREESGRISGLTEIFFDKNRPYRLMQNLTGVREEFRGRGLGKWLKAEMLLRMKEKHPDILYIVTGNADSNAPMLSINHRMGFKKHKSWKAYKYNVSELTNMLV